MPDAVDTYSSMNIEYCPECKFKTGHDKNHICEHCKIKAICLELKD